MKKNKGITLIALVITIIIMLILAGVTLNAALGENGLFKRAKQAARETQKVSDEEMINLKMLEMQMDQSSTGRKYGGRRRRKQENRGNII